MRCSNQLSYEATDVESWSFVGHMQPVKNECEVIICNMSYIDFSSLQNGLRNVLHHPLSVKLIYMPVL